MQRPVEIEDLGKLRDEQRRRDPKRCADHAADHDPQAAPLRNRGQRERLGQPARLVELDSDGLVFPVEPVEIGKRPAGWCLGGTRRRAGYAAGSAATCLSGAAAPRLHLIDVATRQSGNLS